MLRSCITVLTDDELGRNIYVIILDWSRGRASIHQSDIKEGPRRDYFSFPPPTLPGYSSPNWEGTLLVFWSICCLEPSPWLTLFGSMSIRLVRLDLLDRVCPRHQAAHGIDLQAKCLDLEVYWVQDHLYTHLSCIHSHKLSSGWDKGFQLLTAAPSRMYVSGNSP